MDVYSCGTIQYYDKAYDRVTPKNERPLERIEGRAFYKVSTSDDPIIARCASCSEMNLSLRIDGRLPSSYTTRRLHDDPVNKDVRVYATDAIVAALMAAGRSTYSWDIIVNRVGDKLFLDKRIDCPIDYITCNETVGW